LLAVAMLVLRSRKKAKEAETALVLAKEAAVAAAAAAETTTTTTAEVAPGPQLPPPPPSARDRATMLALSDPRRAAQVIEGWHGVPFDAPLGRTREIIDICRAVWRREAPVVHDGRYYQLPLPADRGTGLGKPLKLINHPLRSDIPIWWASLKDKSVEATAELADGWLPIMFIPDRFQQVWGNALKAGNAKRDPNRKQLDIAAGHLGEKGKPGRAVARGRRGGDHLRRVGRPERRRDHRLRRLPGVLQLLRRRGLLRRHRRQPRRGLRRLPAVLQQLRSVVQLRANR
jgi:hypothetical protein